MLSFGNRLSRRGENLQRNTDNLVKRVALSVLTYVADDTPIDTGRAMSNWQVKLNSAERSYIDSHEEGSHGSTASSVLSATILNGQRVIYHYIGGRGKSIHITNNAPYINRLNNGWSAQQSQPGFVERAVISAVDDLKRNRLLDNYTIEVN